MYIRRTCPIKIVCALCLSTPHPSGKSSVKYKEMDSTYFVLLRIDSEEWGSSFASVELEIPVIKIFILKLHLCLRPSLQVFSLRDLLQFLKCMGRGTQGSPAWALPHHGTVQDWTPGPADCVCPPCGVKCGVGSSAIRSLVLPLSHLLSICFPELNCTCQP
jgi:hypothetical protein